MMVADLRPHKALEGILGQTRGICNSEILNTETLES
jgi:hypothetical protein